MADVALAGMVILMAWIMKARRRCLNQCPVTVNLLVE
jgi:hypothetical protein